LRELGARFIMVGMAASRDLKGSRRDLALVFSGEPKTAYEAAKELGRPTGSIFGVLRRMHTDGLLLADTDPDPPTRGTLYRLAESGARLLEETLQPRDELGHVHDGQRLLHVEYDRDLTAASRVLVESVSAGVIAWGAELPAGWLLAMVPDADAFRVRRLVGAFEQAGCRCVSLPVDAVVDGARLRARAATLVGVEPRL
jgi:DNA-binding PadR family transcriptional regulator